ncbi:unannotated protein [freshwater metagenome]|uniref:Unannotated protein n=1 Tax=freshwater metagenome TaxID=449393 RepID=A0A6J6KK91_9ZZZZ
MVNKVAQCFDHFAQVVRRHIGGHAHGNAAGAIDQEVGNSCWQDTRLQELIVVVGNKIDDILV